MTMTTLLSMSLFALVASLTPGPVNLVGVRCGVQFGLKTGVMFVTGATFGFVALFVLIGLGLDQITLQLPWMLPVIKWSGILFLLYLSLKLWLDNGRLHSDSDQIRPTPWLGAIMQWLNPKAWLASIAGISAFSVTQGSSALWIFSLIYLVICWLSLNCWVIAGLLLKEWLNTPSKIQKLNRILAFALMLSCIALSAESF